MRNAPRQEMRFHWKAQRPHQYGVQHCDGMITITTDPFDMELIEIAYEKISELKGWDNGSFVIDSLTLIASRPEAAAGEGKP